MNEPNPKLTLETLPVEIGKRIYKQRVRRDVSQTKLAEECDVSPSFISQLERGEKTPSLETLLVLGRRLDVPISYFFVNEDLSETLSFNRRVAPVLKVVRALALTPTQVVMAAKTIWALYATEAGYKNGPPLD